MGFLKGTINTLCPVQQSLSGSVVKLLVFYLPEGSKTAELIGKREINDLSKFPISFTVDYSEPTTRSVNENFAVYLTVLVEKNGQALFNNKIMETRTGGESKSKDKLVFGNHYGDLVGHNRRYRRHLDVFLNSIKAN